MSAIGGDGAKALAAARALALAGRCDEAVIAFQALIGREAENLAAVLDLGALLRQRGRTPEAIELYLRSSRHCDAPPELWVNLGNAQAVSGDREGAIASYRRALALKPDLAVAARYLGRLLLDANRAAEALPYLRQAAAAMPQDPAVLERLGKALRRLGRWAEAVPVFARLARVKPGNAEAEAELARILVTCWKLRPGIAMAERAIAHDPGSTVAWLTKADALSRRAMHAESAAAFERAATLAPESGEVAQCRLIRLLYDDGLSAQARANEHRSTARLWNRLTPREVAFANPRSTERRLRIGYLSADFRAHHPVAQFALPIFQHHDPAAVEACIYSNAPSGDETTVRFRELAHRFRDISEMDDRQALAAIRADRIDVLIDLSGHTGGSRPSLLARRPAPVQAAYLGYAHSTGLGAMDYAIVDAEVAPSGSEALFTERLLRLAPSLFCFAAPADAPPVSGRPVDGAIVFGSYNNGAKLTPATIALWVQLLLYLPRARLRLKAALFDDDYEIARFTALFAGRGIDANRLDFAPLSPKPEAMMAEFGLIDVALDPVPYNGATTTCLALWMGVPVVSLAGDGYAARMGASLLSAAGHREWVARSPEDYVAIAAGLAGDRQALLDQRLRLRDELEASPLLDGALFTRRLEAIYRQVWADWCRSAGASATIG
jgi:protein O-GlcNAc transferase